MLIGNMILPSDKNDLFYIENPNEDNFGNVKFVCFNDYANDNLILHLFQNF